MKNHYQKQSAYTDNSNAKESAKHPLLIGARETADGGWLSSEQTYSVDADGIHTSTLVIQEVYNEVGIICDKLGKHPYFDYLAKTNYGIQRLPGNIGRGTVTFKGCPLDKEYLRWSVKNTIASRPIEVHPFFTRGKIIPDSKKEISANAKDAYGYAFGLKADQGHKGSNQATYVQSGNSQKFSHFDSRALFDLGGVQTYNSYHVVLSMTLVTQAIQGNETSMKSGWDDGGFIYQVGQVFEFDDLPTAIDIKKSQFQKHGETENEMSWLVTGAKVEIFGMALRQEVELTMSNIKPWNKLIYPATDMATFNPKNSMAH